MIINPYIEQVKTNCPQTYVGLIAYLSRLCNDNKSQLTGLLSSNILIINSYIIGYIEYRQVNFIEAVCNTHYDNPSLNFSNLIGKTITNTLYRLEKNLLPLEGQPF